MKDVQLLRECFTVYQGLRWLSRVEFRADGHRFVAEREVHLEARPDSWSVKVDDEPTIHLGATDEDDRSSTDDIVDALRKWNAKR